MNQSPEEEESQYLSDKRINKIVKKAKAKVWLSSKFAVAGAGVAGFATAYFKQWWILVLAGVCALWIFLRK